MQCNGGDDGGGGGKGEQGQVTEWATQHPTIGGGLQWWRWQPQQRLPHAIVFFVVVVVDNDEDGGRH